MMPTQVRCPKDFLKKGVFEKTISFAEENLILKRYLSRQ